MTSLFLSIMVYLFKNYFCLNEFLYNYFPISLKSLRKILLKYFLFKLKRSQSESATTVKVLFLFRKISFSPK